MSDYLRIARVYLHGTTVAVWCFLLLCLLAISAGEGEIARNQVGILGGVLSRKSYMAMFAYFNACLLGVLLRDNIAHPWASVLPHYRQKHLLVTALIALVFLGIPMLSMEFVGTSDIAPTSVAVIFLTCLAAGLCTPHNPALVVLVFPFLAFVMLHSSASPKFADFLAGANPAASAALVFISLLSLWGLATRLLVLNEEMNEYAFARMWGDLLRGRAPIYQGQSQAVSDSLSTLPADKQAPLQNIDPLKSPYTNLKHVDNLSGYTERSLWQRLQLWRLGTAPTRTGVTVAGQILFSLIIIPIMFILQMVGPELPARNNVVIFSVMVMTNPFIVLHYWFMRRHRLGYESLRPRTRQEFVRELGLVLLWDMFQCWLGGVLCMAIAAGIWAPELLQVQNILLFILDTGAGQLFAYAMYTMIGTWLVKRGIIVSISCEFVPFMTTASWMLFIAEPIGFGANMAIASVLVVASMATIPLAYRRWCRADLN